MSSILDCRIHRTDFQQRISTVRSILQAGSATGVVASPDISKESRGLAIVLLYAAYENLLRTLCTAMLEAAIQLRVGNKRLQKGLKVVAVRAKLQGTSASSQTAIWRHGLDVVETLADGRNCTIASNVFPNDGSNFRRSQVTTFCDVFGLSDPAPILREVWQRLDALVIERNFIAHGQETPGDIGRQYTLNELNDLVDIWDRRWMEFIDWVEKAGSSRDFYRTPR